jgi:hypothetical protein
VVNDSAGGAVSSANTSSIDGGAIGSGVTSTGRSGTMARGCGRTRSGSGSGGGGTSATISGAGSATGRGSMSNDTHVSSSPRATKLATGIAERTTAMPTCTTTDAARSPGNESARGASMAGLDSPPVPASSGSGRRRADLAVACSMLVDNGQARKNVAAREGPRPENESQGQGSRTPRSRSSERWNDSH